MTQMGLATAFLAWPSSKLVASPTVTSQCGAQLSDVEGPCL